MVRIKLVILSDEYAEYEYYPEGNMEAPGIVRLNRKDNQRVFVQESAEDYGRLYAAHALRRIEDYAQKSDFKETDMVAWY